MTRVLEGLVERACRRDELLQAACREPRALSHPERPARGTTCQTCTSGHWPVASVHRIDSDVHLRVCQDCAETLRHGRVVIWDDPWSNPDHEANQPRTGR